MDPRWIEISELDANASPKAQFLGYRSHSPTRPEVAFHLQFPKDSGHHNTQKENSAERLARQVNVLGGVPPLPVKMRLNVESSRGETIETKPAAILIH
jgi:hypothetical protein